MSNELTLDAFLGHSTGGDRGRTNFLGNWKKENPPQIDIVLHRRAPIVALWQMPWPRLVEREKEGVKVTEVWGGSFNTWESEEVCKEQYSRNRESGFRELPPTICPYQLFMERLHFLVHSKKLDWCAPMFKFQGDDASKARVLRAGGMLGMFGSQKLSDDQKRDMARNGIKQSEAWMERAWAKCNYVFRVVDVNNADKGVQVASETTLLGDKVRGVIQDEVTSLGSEDGNPILKPYVIRWMYVPAAKTFNDKYKALRMRKMPVEDDVLDLVSNTDPPSVEHLTRVGNPLQLRADMETYYVGPKKLFNWDEIFEAACESYQEAKDETEEEEAPKPRRKAKTAAKPTPEPEEDDEDDEPEEDDADDEEEAPKPEPKKRTKKKAKPATRVIPEHLQAECTSCGKIISDEDDVCPHCGYDYTVDDEEEEEEPPPPPKARKKAGKKAAAPSDTGDDVGF